jgi:hypothetical protein
MRQIRTFGFRIISWGLEEPNTVVSFARPEMGWVSGVANGCLHAGVTAPLQDDVLLGSFWR